MTYRKLIIPVAAIFLLVISFSAILLARANANGPIPNPVNEIAGYRTWTKVNTEPQFMQRATAQLCAAAVSPASNQVNGPNNPHVEKYITVYVNAVGRQAMMESLKPSFPQGSVIVKEKLPDKASQTPELLTVMIKREKGFNPASGDWEFMVVDGRGTKIESRGKLENCQGCHQARPETDYIFRSYLPDDTLKGLK